MSRLFIALILSSFAVGMVHSDSDDPTVLEHAFLVVFTPGPAWIEGKSVTEQPLSEHGSYLLSLFAQGKVKQAGPFIGHDGNAAGAIVYRADSLDDVNELIANDPGVVSGIMVPTVYPWTLRDWQYFLDRPALKFASGSFEPRRTSLGESDEHGGVTVTRELLEKTYYGDLEGEGRGEMLTSMTPVDGSAGYVAMERVTGTIDGRSGSFMLQHSASMVRGDAAWLKMTVVPDSGTGELSGIDGEMNVEITAGQYHYKFAYKLPAP